MASVVYVLTNSAMPGICKIGRTSQDDVGTRLAQLYSTGVPVPFTLEYACQVDDSETVEAALHTAFGPSRVNPKREFFRIDPEQAIAILKLLDTAVDATAEVALEPTGIDDQSLQAARTLRSRRPNLNFEEMGIPIGATLNCTRADATATVASPKKVDYLGDRIGLSVATRLVMGTDYNLNPGPYWTYDGKTISEIYNDTYRSSD
jgi:hypothetical protein